MRSGRTAALVALSGAACLAAACGAPTGVAGVSTLPPASPAADAAIAMAAADTSPKVEAPVRIPPPELSRFTYTFPVKGCEVTYSRKLLVLPKTTIWAARGCAFVSPVDGVVREVNANNRWAPSTDHGWEREGRFVSVIGDDGVAYLGGHLESVEPGLAPGTQVKAGQRLGTVGNSGNARDLATNLYFAISWPTPPQYWWIRRGMVEPWRYLDAWDDGNRTLSPRRETLTLRKRLGEFPACTQLCASKPGSPPKPERKPKPPTKHRPKDPEVVVVTPN
ncbi:M23 family metallopeptidase [Sphaerimonospora cavernae]|uniref:M23 family metallopeptidase n=1 Tax=Sphaerimonospora cavernae TaxID=1740611 RepID=A0ABV6U228_9ACTN